MAKGFMDYKTYDTSNGFGNANEWKRTFKKRISPDEAKHILQEDDPWAILGINANSSKSDIKKAYRALALKWHPDKNLNNIAFSTEMMKKINAAYNLLS